MCLICNMLYSRFFNWSTSYTSFNLLARSAALRKWKLKYVRSKIASCILYRLSFRVLSTTNSKSLCAPMWVTHVEDLSQRRAGGTHTRKKINDIFGLVIWYPHMWVSVSYFHAVHLLMKSQNKKKNEDLSLKTCGVDE